MGLQLLAGVASKLLADFAAMGLVESVAYVGRKGQRKDYKGAHDQPPRKTILIRHWDGQ